MIRPAEVFALGALAGVAAISLVHCATHRPPTVPPLVAAYAAEVAGCIDAAETLEQSRACRARVRARYGPALGLALDGGAP